MSATPSGEIIEQRLNVLIVVEYFYPSVGGVETLFTQLALALASAGHRVCVITLQLPNTAPREVYRGVEIIRVSAPRWGRRFFFTLWAIPETWKRARTADLIHTTTYNAAFPAWLASLCRSRPCIITVHEVFADQWNNLPGLNRFLGYGFRLFEWAVLHLPFAHFVCDSEFTRRRLLDNIRVPPADATVVYPAVEYHFWDPKRHQPRPLRAELGLHPNTFLYLYFGRPGVSKGVEYLLKAAESVRDKLPESRLVLLLSRVPEDGYRRAVEQIKSRGLSSHVILLESVPREQLPGYLLAANCIVIPSISEGFGYAAVEAATIGCRVIATKGHSVEEILSEYIQLVPPRDPAALARAIVAQSQSEPPVIPVPPRFDVATHVAGMSAVYRQVLALKRRRSPSLRARGVRPEAPDSAPTP